MSEPGMFHWVYWALFAWATMTALEAWGKIDPERLPLFQRIASFCLAAFALPFWLWMLWRTYAAFGGWYTAKAFFAGWVGMLILSVAVFGIYGLFVSFLVKDPKERGPYLSAFRYDFFTPKLLLALGASYLLFNAYR